MNGSAQSIALPKPVLKGSVSLEEALAKRQSIRSFSPDPLTLRDLSQLLWAAQGKTHGGRKRTAPSAGATYPLEVYAAVRSVEGVRPGVYRYLPDSHVIQSLHAGDVSKQLCDACWNQRFVESAPVNIVLTAVSERTERRYGERAERYVSMEAGHAGQNLYLQATALGLGTVAVGAFDDESVRSVLGVPESVLYIFPVGKKTPEQP